MKKRKRNIKKDIFNEKTEQLMLLFGEINDLNFLFFPFRKNKRE